MQFDSYQKGSDPEVHILEVQPDPAFTGALQTCLVFAAGFVRHSKKPKNATAKANEAEERWSAGNNYDG